MHKIAHFTSLALPLLIASRSLAQESASLNASNSEGVNANAATSEPEFTQAPFEFGAFGGLMFLSKSHNLHHGTQLPFNTPSLELGGRGAVYPLPYVGIEVEGAGSALHTKVNPGELDGLFLGRGHLIGQLPLNRWALFALVGGGAMTIASNQNGSKTGPEFHFGLGAKVAFNELIGARLDVRDTLSSKFGPGSLTNSPEVLLGLTFSARRAEKVLVAAAAPADSDNDQINDDRDACPDVAGPAPDGCPDSDGDGVFDNKDACPKEAGSGCGCPLKDRDGDHFVDELDRCPDEAGTIEGCKDTDPDRDRVSGAADRCPNEPETMNGFEDGDGCPDVVPEKVKKFTGIIQGIEFDRNGERVRPGYTAALDNAVLVLKEYPSLRILITGHTDTDGSRDYNVTLSLRRATTVKTYLVDRGIDSSRIETFGAAFDEPIADNKTNEGKQKNRRIEFKLLQGDSAAAAPPVAATPAKPADTLPKK